MSGGRANQGTAAGYTLRPATSADVETIVAFTLQEAWESDGETKDPADVARGVGAAFGERPPSIYWVAVAPDRQLAASISAVTEWSNFHGGWYWWIQSFFVAPAHRGRGLVELMLDHVAREARAAGALDLRLYARASNERALRAYRRCGFTESPYIVMSRAPGSRGQSAP